MTGFTNVFVQIKNALVNTVAAIGIAETWESRWATMCPSDEARQAANGFGNRNWTAEGWIQLFKETTLRINHQLTRRGIPFQVNPPSSSGQNAQTLAKLGHYLSELIGAKGKEAAVIRGLIKVIVDKKQLEIPTSSLHKNHLSTTARLTASLFAVLIQSKSASGSVSTSRREEQDAFSQPVTKKFPDSSVNEDLLDRPPFPADRAMPKPTMDILDEQQIRALNANKEVVQLSKDLIFEGKIERFPNGTISSQEGKLILQGKVINEGKFGVTEKGAPYLREGTVYMGNGKVWKGKFLFTSDGNIYLEEGAEAVNGEISTGKFGLKPNGDIYLQEGTKKMKSNDVWTGKFALTPAGKSYLQEGTKQLKSNETWTGKFALAADGTSYPEEGTGVMADGTIQKGKFKPQVNGAAYLDEGRVQFPNGAVLDGKFGLRKDGSVYFQKGIMKAPVGRIYDGTFALDEQEEHYFQRGKVTLEDGSTQEGEFETSGFGQPSYIIRGKTMRADGAIFDGTYALDEQGKHYFQSGKVILKDGNSQEGEFTADEPWQPPSLLMMGTDGDKVSRTNRQSSGTSYLSVLAAMTAIVGSLLVFWYRTRKRQKKKQDEIVQMELKAAQLKYYFDELCSGALESINTLLGLRLSTGGMKISNNTLSNIDMPDGPFTYQNGEITKEQLLQVLQEYLVFPSDHSQDNLQPVRRIKENIKSQIVRICQQSEPFKRYQATCALKVDYLSVTSQLGEEKKKFDLLSMAFLPTKSFSEIVAHFEECGKEPKAILEKVENKRAFADSNKKLKTLLANYPQLEKQHQLNASEALGLFQEVSEHTPGSSSFNQGWTETATALPVTVEPLQSSNNALNQTILEAELKQLQGKVSRLVELNLALVQHPMKGIHAAYEEWVKQLPSKFSASIPSVASTMASSRLPSPPLSIDLPQPTTKLFPVSPNSKKLSAVKSSPASSSSQSSARTMALPGSSFESPSLSPRVGVPFAMASTKSVPIDQTPLEKLTTQLTSEWGSVDDFTTALRYLIELPLQERVQGQLIYKSLIEYQLPFLNLVEVIDRWPSIQLQLQPHHASLVEELQGLVITSLTEALNEIPNIELFNRSLFKLKWIQAHSTEGGSLYHETIHRRFMELSTISEKNKLAKEEVASSLAVPVLAASSLAASSSPACSSSPSFPVNMGTERWPIWKAHGYKKESPANAFGSELLHPQIRRKLICLLKELQLYGIETTSKLDLAEMTAGLAQFIWDTHPVQQKSGGSHAHITTPRIFPNPYIPVYQKDELTAFYHRIANICHASREEPTTSMVNDSVPKKWTPY